MNGNVHRFTITEEYMDSQAHYEEQLLLRLNRIVSNFRDHRSDLRQNCEVSDEPKAIL